MIKLLIVALGSMMIPETDWLAHEQARSGLLSPAEVAQKFMEMILEFQSGKSFFI